MNQLAYADKRVAYLPRMGAECDVFL
jgi:hypothetical protein